MDLKDLDLNLLRVFVQLVQDRKVSLAAENLGLSQPAVSNALARLRRLLGDDLFLRTSRGMQPTPLAEQLAQPIQTALASIQDSLASKLSFEAASSGRQFALAMTDIGEFHFLPQLMAGLAVVAPGVTISTVRSTAVNLRFEMENGKVDLAIGHLPDLSTDFHRRHLFTQRYVCLMRKGHPMLRAADPLKAFEQAKHAQVVSAGTGHGRVDEVIARGGVQRRIHLSVPHFVALADILEKSDLVATVPQAFALRSVQHFKLALLDHPVRLPPIDINLFWHAKAQREPGNQWLREQIVRQFSQGASASVSTKARS